MLLLSGCVTSSQQHEKVTNPVKSMQTRQQLKSEEDIEYFNKVQKNNSDAWIKINIMNNKY